MKTIMRVLLYSAAVLCLAALFAPSVLAQAQPAAPAQAPQPNPDAHSKYSRVKYDKAAEVTIVGTVVEVQDFECPVSGSEGAHLLMQTAEGKILVHVAPVKFMKEYGITLKQGDKLTILGAKMKDGEGGDTMLARTITSAEVMIAVRTPDGKPLW